MHPDPRTPLRFTRSEILGWSALAVGCLLLALATSGCASARAPGASLINPLTWFARAEATTADRAEAKLETARDAEDRARDELLKRAQRTAHETELAILSAPASRPVDVAAEASQATTAALDQALGSLPVEQLAAVRAQIAALLSDNAALRAEGESARATQRARDAQISHDLAEATRRTANAEAIADAARSDLRAAFDRENTLANELRGQQFQTMLARGLSVAAALAALAYRANALGLADGLARGIADLRRKQPGVADLATQALDTGLNRAEQTTVSRLVHRHLAS